MTALLEALTAAATGIASVPTCWPTAAGACAVAWHRDCEHPGKRPLFSRKFATTDVDIITRDYIRFPRAGVKYVTFGEHATIDVDAKNCGVETTTKWFLEHGPLPPTWADTNGHDDGGHYVLTVPGGFEGVLVLGPGVEVFGRKSEIAMPPTPYYRGGARGWRPGYSPRDVAIAEAPGWLQSKIRLAELHRSRPRPAGAPLTSEEIAEFEHIFSTIGVESRGRSRGLFYCPFHSVNGASLSVNWQRGVFKCHSTRCTAQGSLYALRRLTASAA